MAYSTVHDYNYNEAPPVVAHETLGDESRHQPPQQDHITYAETQSLTSWDGQKIYPTAEYHQVNPYWNNPIPTGPSHHRGWSGSTATVDIPLEDRSPPKSDTKSLKQKSPSSGGGSWTLEIVTILFACAAVGGIMGVLARFENRPLPDWPYYITLNALIALLAAVALATMSVSLQNGISQLKWIRFKESRAPLADMETFDEASRGTWGALKLLATARGGFLGSFGAVIAIVSLALGPFAQQIITYQMRTVMDESPGSATIARAQNYTGALPGNTSSTGYVPILPLKSAVYNGLFAENGRPNAALKFERQTGNCTWSAFDTIGVCHECVDLTPYMSRYCAASDDNNQDCGWKVPQGPAYLNSSADVFSMTPLIPSASGDMPHSTIMRLVFMGTEAKDGLAGELKPWAQQCALSVCLQTIDAAVANGVLSENVTARVVNRTVVDMTRDTSSQDFAAYVTGQDGEVYNVGMEALLSMRGWFSSLFAAGRAVRTTADANRTITDNSVVVNLTVGISSGVTFFDSDIVTAFYWNYYEYQDADGIDMLMSDMATSMTVAFRSFFGAVPVSGKAISMESFVHVRWGFAVLPIVVVVATVLFLMAAIYRTRQSNTKALKSSALAMLFHGLDEDIRSQFGSVRNLNDKKRQARVVKVQLNESDGKSLLRG
ncbi:hypothetical protein PFICI_09853 [Pestalotiopsis fici W106-1]|uniref:Uncharacterized protein n=1 Tax=Pestalotiopsis fici (strain W106-1 / CGMCC3.15140) TaxID=1229662 RepID=W3WY31_PESFW|nr:uncharacterized protein PFICI_09853 [Pestalotiopsis fici W106-1]ETS77791.1 hypothetical protein PFICI_09853 [Pestalotiopsis fici W106-1]